MLTFKEDTNFTLLNFLSVEITHINTHTHTHTHTHTNRYLCISLTAILRFTKDDIEMDLRVPQIPIHL